jgi:hypothetical protein
MEKPTCLICSLVAVGWHWVLKRKDLKLSVLSKTRMHAKRTGET